MASLKIEPATFWLAVQCLNHLRHSVSHSRHLDPCYCIYIGLSNAVVPQDVSIIILYVLLHVSMRDTFSENLIAYLMTLHKVSEDYELSHRYIISYSQAVTNFSHSAMLVRLQQLLRFRSRVQIEHEAVSGK
jgi:hypothetical protein